MLLAETFSFLKISDKFIQILYICNNIIIFIHLRIIMIRQITLFFLFYFFATHNYFCFSQSIVIFDTKNSNVTGQTIIVSDPDLTITHNLALKTKNTSLISKTIKVRRYETNVLPNTSNYFCWSLCYSPVNAGAKPVWTDIGNVSMLPDSLYANLKAYYVPNGLSGVSSFRYVLFDENNTNDSSYVDVVFDITTGINSISEHIAQIYLFPNPAFDKLFVEFSDNQFPGNNTLEVYNIIGEKIENITLSGKGKTVVINSSKYNSGIYFCVLKENGVTNLAKKFIVGK